MDLAQTLTTIRDISPDQWITIGIASGVFFLSILTGIVAVFRFAMRIGSWMTRTENLQESIQKTSKETAETLVTSVQKSDLAIEKVNDRLDGHEIRIVVLERTTK